MQLKHKKNNKFSFFYFVSLLIICPFLSAENRVSTQEQQKKPLKIFFDMSEGGSSATRQKQKIKSYLQSKSCYAELSFSETLNKSHHDLLLIHLSSQAKSLHLKKILGSYSSLGKTVQAALLVRKSTAIKQLSSLLGERISYVNQHSITGFQDQIKLIENTLTFKKSAKQKTNNQKHNKLFAGSHVAALTLLMHKDSFAAGIEYSLALKWAEKNNLSIIKAGKKRQLGGLYIQKSYVVDDKKNLENCIQAFKALNRKNKKSKRLMKIFPEWLIRFE